MPGESDITIEVVVETPVELTIVDESPIIIELGETGPAGSDGIVTSIEPGDNITVDDTDPAHPIVSAEVPVLSVNGEIGDVVLTQDDVGDGASFKQYSSADKTKLAGIEALADVTDATNVAVAGAFMKAVDDTDDITVGATNKFATATEKTKLGFIAVTQAVNLDTMESDIANKQPLDSDLTAIATLDSSTSGAIASDGAGWVKKTYAQFKTALGLVKADVGLGNVDNTSDLNKPISTATQTALNLKKTDSMSTNKLLGRGTAGTGVIEEITLGTNLSLAGTTLNATGSGGSDWGDIGGDINDQTDLIALFDTKLESVVAGTNVTIDDTDPLNPIINASGGSGSPGGSDTEVQFNDSGAFGGHPALTFDKTNSTTHVDILNVDVVNSDFIITGDGTAGTASSTPSIALGVEVGGNENAHIEINSPENGVAYIDLTTVNEDYKMRIGWFDADDELRFILGNNNVPLTLTGDNTALINGGTGSGSTLEVNGSTDSSTYNVGGSQFIDSNKDITANDITGTGDISGANLSGTNTGDQDLSGLQPLDSDLTAIAGLSPSNDDFLQRKAGAWTNRTVAQVKTDLGLTGSNSGDVTLAGTPDYITISGQVITRNKLDPADDLNTFASSVLAGLLTDETGTDKVVFNTSPGFATAANPISSDGATLGTVSLPWSDLFLASGAIINFANANVNIAHTTGFLTVSQDLRITTVGTNVASVPTLGSSSILTNKTLTTPTIASFTNATHDHSNAAGGGNIPQASVTNLVTDLGNKQPLDSDLTTIAGLTATTDNVMQAKAGAWASRTLAQLMTDLAALGTTFQPLDSDLTTIAGLTATTNNFMVASGSAWASRTPTQAIAHLGLDADIATLVLPASTTISTYGASLIDDADASTARTTLGLIIGTNVQAWDADLDTIAGLTATTNNFLVSVSSAWASRTPAQVKTTLSLDNVDNTSNATERAATATLTNKRVTKRRVTVNAPGATPTTNTDNCDIAIFTGLNAAITSMTTNLSGTPIEGDTIEFWFTDNGTARAITWGASFVATTVALPTTTVISTRLRVKFEYSTAWDLVSVV